MKIGTIDIDRPVILAPMEDVTDRAFRQLCKRHGADIVYTEFISAEALRRGVEKSIRKLKTDEIERPFAIQIFGNTVESMIEAAVIAEEFGPDYLDINFGCPTKKVAGKGAGAALLKEPDKMTQIAEAVVKAVKVPVTAKTRIGWDLESINILDILPRLEDAGIQRSPCMAAPAARCTKARPTGTGFVPSRNKPASPLLPMATSGRPKTPQQCLPKPEQTA